MKQSLSKEEQRLARRTARIIVLVLLVVLALVVGLSQWATNGWRIQVADATEAQRAAAEGLDTITVSLSFDPTSDVPLHATQTLTLTNRTGQAQSAVVLRSYTGAYRTEETSPAASDELFAQSYPNGFSAGGLSVELAAINGEPVTPQWADEAHTVLTLQTSTPWLPGETCTVALTWAATVPQSAGRFGTWGGVTTLGNLRPTPAVWLGDAWDTREVVAVGDPFVTDCANYSVILTLPATYTVAASAYAEPTRSGDQAIYQFSGLALRDFALVLYEQAAKATARVGDVQIIAYATTAQHARNMAQAAQRAIYCYQSRWGDYAYPVLTLCEVDFPYGGMEYTALTLLSQSTVQSASMETSVAHEVAHQWWGIAVGSDAWSQPWQDESLATYAVLDYVGDTSGRIARQLRIEETYEAAMRITVPGNLTPASPLDYFGSLSTYGYVVYYRGSGLWLAFENLLGHTALDAVLTDYYDTYRFGFASREDLTALLSGAAGYDVSALMVDYLDTVISN